jgi:hypothetical protein
MSQHELLAELDIVERAIARTSTFARSTDELGRTRVRVSPELLACQRHLPASKPGRMASACRPWSYPS